MTEMDIVLTEDEKSEVNKLSAKMNISAEELIKLSVKKFLLESKDKIVASNKKKDKSTWTTK